VDLVPVSVDRVGDLVGRLAVPDHEAMAGRNVVAVDVDAVATGGVTGSKVARLSRSCRWSCPSSNVEERLPHGFVAPQRDHTALDSLLDLLVGPADVTDRFRELTRRAGLPPIQLHDLRHGAATLALAAGVDPKVVQHMLRHSSITVTMNIYTTVLPEVALAAAEATAKIIPRQSASSLGLPQAPERPQWTVQKRMKSFRIAQNPRLKRPSTWGVGVRHQGLEPRTLVKSPNLEVPDGVE
jgi:hypothetical protein